MTPGSASSAPGPEHWRGRRSPALGLLAWLLALGPLVFIPGLVDFSRLPQQAFVQLSVLVMMLVRLFEMRPLRRTRWPWRSFDAPILALLAAAALSMPGAVDPVAGLPLLFHWACCALVYLLVSRALDDEADASRLVAGLVAGAGVLALVGLAQAVGDLEVVPQAAGPSSTMANRNVVAGYLVMVAPLALLLWHRGGRVARFTALAVTAAIVVYLPFSLSRLAALALGVQLLALTLVGARKAGGASTGTHRRRGLAAGLLGVLCLAVGIAWLSTHDAAKRRSLDVRVVLARASVEMFLEDPLAGVGLGNFAVHYPRLGPPIRLLGGLPRPGRGKPSQRAPAGAGRDRRRGRAGPAVARRRGPGRTGPPRPRARSRGAPARAGAWAWPSWVSPSTSSPAFPSGPPSLPWWPRPCWACSPPARPGRWPRPPTR